MLTTQTELTDLLRKLFEGLGYGVGEDDDCARRVAWLAMRDVPILERLARESEAFVPVKRVTILQERPAEIHLDGSSGNLMGIAVDLLRSGFERVVVDGCRVPETCVPYLAECGGRAVWAIDGVRHEVGGGEWRLKSAETPLPLTLQSAEAFTFRGDIYQNNLENGLFVVDPIWQELYQLGRAILVPETDHSRRFGAG